MKAVIDRFEGTLAVVLVGSEEIQLYVPKDELPAEAVEGSWLTIGFALDQQGEQRQRQKIQNLLDKLKHKYE